MPERGHLRNALVFGILAMSAGCDEPRRPPPALPPWEAVRSADLYVGVGADGLTQVGTEILLEDRAILTRLEAYAARSSRPRARVACDQAALHGRLVRVLDLIREGGVTIASVELIP